MAQHDRIAGGIGAETMQLDAAVEVEVAGRRLWRGSRQKVVEEGSVILQPADATELYMLNRKVERLTPFDI
jgi:hypothetical protein